MRSNPKSVQKFRALVWSHYRREGRHFLPWRKTRNAYAITVSEIMLQQTQVARVLLFYTKFLKKFPTFQTLARAPRHEVLAHWQGLGYNRRAVALHKLAVEIIQRYKGKLPHDPEALKKLPGIGAATAGAIAAFAFNAPSPFVETNIRRAIILHFFPRARTVGEPAIVELVRCTLPSNNAREWYYALMDYGAWLSKQGPNPNRRHANYRPQPTFKGSVRELRGKMVKYVLKHPKTTARILSRALKEPLPRVEKIFAALKKEGLAT